MRRGFTLLELLVAMAIIALLTVGVTQAYVTGIDYDAKVRAGRDADQKTRAFEDRIKSLLEHAFLSTESTDTTTYFVATDSGSGGADNITFTTIGDGIPRASIDSQDDFETQNQNYGPQGGVEEVSISQTPVGTPSNTEGLFIREQRPADGDKTQGGYESRLLDQISEILFEFWDGTQWITSWDTDSDGRRLPAAVRITYRISSDSDQRSFVVRIPSSDVTADNPMTTSSSQ